MKITEKVKVAGCRVLVRLVQIEKAEEIKSEGGVILEVRTKSKNQVYQEAEYVGHVMDIGPLAETECQIGDCVQISKYSGSLANIPDNDEDDNVYRIVNDIDIQAIFPQKRVNK